MGLNDLKKKIEKASKGTHVSVLSQSDIAKSVDTIETPSYDLNRILSGNLFKGLPLKSLSLMIGPESSGKSSMAALCVAEAQRKGYSPIILDTEGA
jgi:RecA/RadA recombinase